MQHIRDNRQTMLVNWTYSTDEWRKFIRWKTWKRGIFPYILYRLRPGRRIQPAIIQVSEARVSIDGIEESFNDSSRYLSGINIKEMGNMNVMEIVYQLNNDGIQEIRIPVPHGRLKEAIALEVRLNELRLNQRDWQQ